MSDLACVYRPDTTSTSIDVRVYGRQMIFDTEYCSSEPNVRNIVLLSENAYYAPEVICTLGVNP